jgi:SAM-dependent methyltransferase
VSATKPQFDSYHDTYREEVERSISFVGPGLDFFTEAKARELLDLISRRLGAPGEMRALDVGCGTGETDAYLAPHLAELEGVDVSDRVLETARRRNPTVGYTAYDGERLPFEAGRFDLSFAICVLHHVPSAQWERFLREMARVVRPGGLVAIVEHNPYNPLTRLAVHRCEFDDEAELMARGQASAVAKRAGIDVTDARYILFFPWPGEAWNRLGKRLAGIPMGAQYLVAGRPR